MRDPVHVSEKLLEAKNGVEGESKSENEGKGRETEESTAPAVTEGKTGSAEASGEALRFESVSSTTIPLTKYEKSRIVGARALQISLGAPVLVQLPAGVVDPLAIAEVELKMNVLPITVRRKLPGDRFQNISLSKLAKEWL
nr:DNA-directed RNA polymerase subunit K [Candidatus Njordarchaeum guaymaensis]